MPEKEASFSELRRMIAAACDVVVSKRDPVMIFLLLARQAYKEGRQGFADDLETFRGDLAELAARLEDGYTRRAERFLNIALEKSDEALEESRKKIIAEAKTLLENSIRDYYKNHVEKSHKTLRAISYACLGTSFLLLLTSLMVVVIH